MRHTIVWLALAALLIVAATAAVAAPVRGSHPIAVMINGQTEHFATPPIMMRGQVLVPMRDVFQALNAPVMWHARTRTVTAHNAHAISLRVGSRRALVGQQPVRLAVAPRFYHGRIYIPLSFVRDSLNADVAWNPTDRVVSMVSAVRPAVAMAPRRYAEAPPQMVAPAQPQVPPQPQPGMQGQCPVQPQVMAPSQAQAPAEAQVVKVSLKQFSITIDPTEVHPGLVTFQVRNDGTINHGFTIEGTSLAAPILKPGQTATLTMTAEAGKTYTLYCPVDQHRALGMEVQLPVV